MLRRDWVRAFAIRLGVVYVLLVIPWPGVERGFSVLYRGSTNLLVGMVGLKEYLHAGVPDTYHPRGDVALAGMNPQTGQRVRLEYGSRDWAFLSLAAGLALSAAIPPPCPGRIRSGIILMCLITLFAILRIAVASIYVLGNVQAIPMSNTVLKALGNVMMGFSATPITSFVVPVILWLLVFYRTSIFGKSQIVDEDQGSLSGAEAGQ